MCSQKSSEAAGCETSWLAGCLRITAVILLSILPCKSFNLSNRASGHLGRFLAAKARHPVAPEFLGTNLMKWQENTGNDTVLNDMPKQPGNERQKRACMNVYCILFDSICIMDRLWHSQFFLTDPDLVQKCSMMCSLQILPRTSKNPVFRLSGFFMPGFWANAASKHQAGLM